MTKQRDGRIRLDLANATGKGTTECPRGACAQLDGETGEVLISRMQLDLRIVGLPDVPNIYSATGRVEGQIGWDLTGNGEFDVVSRWQGSIEGTFGIEPIDRATGLWDVEIYRTEFVGTLLGMPGMRIAIDHVGAG